MCFICGQPDFIRCNCVAEQPFCDQCEPDIRCAKKMDAQCLIYHFLTDAPTQLINLGMPNGSSAEEIFEAIDDLIGSNFNIPFLPVNTPSIIWTAGGPAGHRPEADVQLSSDSGNDLIERVNGLYFQNDHKVKVDINDTADYLNLQIVGTVNPSGNGLAIDIVNIGGQLVTVPYLDFDLFSDYLSEFLIANDTNSINHTIIPGSPNILTSAVKRSATAGNIILEFSDGIYASAGGSGSGTVEDARNGLSLDGTFVELGGTLIQNTLIDGDDFNLKLDNNVLLLGNLTSLAYTQPVGYGTGENIRFEIFHKTPIRDSSCGTSRFYNALVLDDVALLTLNNHQFIGTVVNSFFHFKDDATFGASTQESNFAAFLSVAGESNAAIQSPNMLTAMLAGIYFENPSTYGETASGSPGTIDNMAIYKTQVPTFQPGMSAANTPAVTNLYSLYLSDLSGGSAIGRFTNKFGIYQAGAGEVNRFFGIVQNSGGATQFTSDERIKENVIPYSKGLDIIEKINTIKYDYKEFTKNPSKGVIGVLAQELEKIFPEAVSKTEMYGFNDFRMVKESYLIYTLINAVQELSQKVKDLESKIYN